MAFLLAVCLAALLPQGHAWWPHPPNWWLDQGSHDQRYGVVPSSGPYGGANQVDVPISQLVRSLTAELEEMIGRVSSLHSDIDMTHNETGIFVVVTGMSKDDLNVQVDERMVRVAGKSASSTVLLRRTLVLPQRVVDASGITANFEDGKVIVFIPSNALEPEPKRLHGPVAISIKQLEHAHEPAKSPSK